MAAGDGLVAAAAFVDVTPPIGRPMGGYVARDQLSIGSHDPLLASLIWLADPQADVLWVALDALGVDAELGLLVRQRVALAAGIQPDSVIIAASHTHAGPSGWLRPLYPGFPSTRDESLRAALAETVAGAAARLRPRPVRARWAVARSVGVGRDRNDPARRHEDTSGVLA